MFGLIAGSVAVVAGLGTMGAIYHMNKRIDDSGSEYAKKHKKSPMFGLIGVALGVVLIGSQCLYTQDAGDVVVLRDFGGNIAGSTSETGFHFKAPWQDCITYDIRNNVISFIKDGTAFWTV